MTEITFQPRVTVLAGFSATATEAVARTLLVTDPTLVLVTHDLSAVRDGLVRRTIRTADQVLEEGLTTLVHGCVSCTLREDVLPTLVHLSRTQPGSDILLALPPAVEPEAVASACVITTVDGVAVSDAVQFDSYVTVVEGAGFLDDLTSTDDLRDRDMHAADNDHRSVADVVSRQLEFADTIVVWDHPAFDTVERERLTALLHRLVPWAAHVRVGDTSTVDCTALAARLLRSGRHEFSVPGTPGRALEGYPVGIHDPAGEHGVTAMLFQARRPFHPQRLHDALDDLTAEALRGRGQLWIATQPDTAISWESAGGGILLGNLGPWLAALPHTQWDKASDMRRLAADADWDPYYGDRRTTLSFVGFGLDVPTMTATLESCLLTDAELADGGDGWIGLPDPFADFFPLYDERDAAATRN